MSALWASQRYLHMVRDKTHCCEGHLMIAPMSCKQLTVNKAVQVHTHAQQRSAELDRCCWCRKWEQNQLPPRAKCQLPSPGPTSTS